MSESIQKKLGRVRPPRVRITYDVETGGAIERKELPFIVGIFSDLAGASPNEAKPIGERKFVEIDRDNFNKIMESITPAVNLTGVTNMIPKDMRAEGTEDQKELAGLLTFVNIDEFDPVEVVKRIAPLTDVYNVRSRIRDMQSKMETSSKLNAIAEKLIAPPPAADDEAAMKAYQETKALLDELMDEKLFEKNKSEAWGDVTIPDATKKAIYNLMLSEEGNEQVEKYTKRLLGQFVWDVIKLDPGVGLQAKLDAKAKEIADKQAETPETDAGIALRDKQLEKLKKEHEDIEKKKVDLAKKGVFARMDFRVAQLDEVISDQLNRVMHCQGFRQLEATWRGLHYLVSRSETGTMLKLRVMNIKKDELFKDLDKAVEFDQSNIFKMIYEWEYGTYGGYPYSVLIGDYEFDRKPKDMGLLNKVSEIAASAHAPFIAAADAKLFGLGTFGHLANPRDLAKIFESAELIEWRAFRESEDSRYVTLTLPRVLLRLPYGGERGKAVDGIDFIETIDGEDEGSFLWGNPAYILAERITNAFAIYGWTAAIRGVEGGGLVEGLPAYTFNTAEGDVKLVCPTQVSITDRREKELNDLGFMAICHCKGENRAAFFGGQTTNQPKKYITDAANANAQISAMLPYVLCASRFAHYIKVIMREKIGSFLTRANVETFLNDWISQYVLLDDNAVQEVKAAYPLRAARIDVTDIPGKPGAYNATVFLKPHFQLEELTTSIRLVAELPA